jgi:hypothetical protein
MQSSTVFTLLRSLSQPVETAPQQNGPLTIKIKDSTFAHHASGARHISIYDSDKSNKLEWDRHNISENDLCVYTDCHLTESNNPDKSIAWLIEPIEINSQIYDTIKNVAHKFIQIFTHDKSLLDLDPKYKLIPATACWIDPSHRGISQKTKNVSIIASFKNWAIGHRLRHEIIRKLGHRMDIYGSGYNEIANKITGLEEYRYSIVIENSKRDYYFTEKLIDCLITGTIPIYWGCPSIGDFFDIRGFIIFDSITELESILDNLSQEDWNSKLEYIKINYENAKKYLSPENIIYEFFRNL